MRYHLLLGGGVGDALITYLDHPVSCRMVAIKRAHPDFEVHVWAQVHNCGIEDLFWYHPCVTRHIQIVQLPQWEHYEDYDRSLLPADWRDLGDFPNQDKYAKSEPIILLSEGEQRQLDELFDTDVPTTVIQPFAGRPQRDAFDESTLTQVLKALPGRKLIVGRNAPRVLTERLEVLGVNRKDTINLIDRIGIRFTYYLMQRADAFVGSHSSVVLLAWRFDKPSVCIVPKGTVDNWNWNKLSPGYRSGEGRENTKVLKFKNRSEIDAEVIANHLRPYLKGK